MPFTGYFYYSLVTLQICPHKTRFIGRRAEKECLHPVFWETNQCIKWTKLHSLSFTFPISVPSTIVLPFSFSQLQPLKYHSLWRWCKWQMNKPQWRRFWLQIMLCHLTFIRLFITVTVWTSVQDPTPSNKAQWNCIDKIIWHFTALDHPPHSKHLAPYDFCPFPKLKNTGDLEIT